MKISLNLFLVNTDLQLNLTWTILKKIPVIMVDLRMHLSGVAGINTLVQESHVSQDGKIMYRYSTHEL